MDDQDEKYELSLSEVRKWVTDILNQYGVCRLFDCNLFVDEIIVEFKSRFGDRKAK